MKIDLEARAARQARPALEQVIETNMKPLIKLALVLVSLLIAALAWRLARRDPSGVEPVARSGPAMAREPATLEPAVDGADPGGRAPGDVGQRAPAALEGEAGSGESAAAEGAPAFDLAAVAGIVLRPDGSPAVGADVFTGELLSRAQAKRDAAPPGYQSFAADESGAFHFEGLEGGFLRLTAVADDAAPSATLELELVSGERREGVVLELTRGGRIRGEVFGLDGRLVSGREVRVMQSETRLVQFVNTDEQGRFVAEHLHPGTWGLVSLPTKAEAEEHGLGGSALLHMAQETVELADGEERFVSLGAPPAHPVRVTGSVTLGDAPQRAFLQWMAEGDDPIATQVLGETDAEGRFEVTLGASGAWWVGVVPMGGGARSRQEVSLDVPEVEVFERDFVLPAGRVSGTVLDSSGVALEGVRVALHLEQGRAMRTPLAMSGDTATTKEDGSFAFSGLGPGAWRVVARGHEVALPDGPMALGGASALVELGADEEVTGIDLELLPGGALEGTVVDEQGQPVALAAVYLFDEQGNACNPIADVHSDAAGAFASTPLAPGEYFALAVRGERVGTSAAPVRVDPSTPAHVELTIVPGGFLSVELRGPEDDREQLFVQVEDEGDRVFSGLRDSKDPWAFFTGGLDTRAVRVGPLPPGSYRVRAIGAGAREGRATVTVDGPGEQTVRTGP